LDWSVSEEENWLNLKFNSEITPLYPPSRGGDVEAGFKPASTILKGEWGIKINKENNIMKNKMKKVLKSAVIGASMLAMVGTAHAGKTQVNLYGASAQYKFWTSAAPAFLLAKGCAATDVYVAVQEDACAGDRDAGVAVCAGDTAYGNVNANPSGGMGGAYGNNTIVFTYTTYASFEGINAVKSTGDPDSCNGGIDTGFRLLPSEATIILVNYAGDPTVGSIPECACLDVVLGASDVKPVTFMQASSGEKKGPCGGGLYESSVFNYSIPSGFLEYEPIVVPFSFFVNGSDDHAVPFDNLSREMVLLLYGQSVNNWNFFDDDLDGDGTPNEPGAYLTSGNGGDSLPVVLCLRHAGSGTHATLQAGVLRNDTVMPTTQNINPMFLPVTYFNKGSSDMMRCVGGGCTGWLGYGAVGYADSDKCCDDTVGVVTCPCKDGMVKRVEYQGYIGDRNNIKNGFYAFWAAQHIYQDSADTQDLKDLSSALMTYAADPANIPVSRADWWAAQGEMKVEKATDFTMPTVK